MGLLPEGYKRLLYIESTGTQYINTGFNPNNNTRVLMDVQHNNYTANGSYFFYFGCTDGTNTLAIGDASSADNLIRHYYGGTNYGNTWNVPIGSRRIVDCNKQTAIVDGTAKSYSTYTFSFNIPMFLFGYNNRGAFAYSASMKLFSCKIWDNGDLVRNYVPAKNPDGVVGLYDTVNGAFNAGVGTFVAGPEWGYVELEYIQSSGTQYVDCGISVPHATARTVVDFEVTTTGTTQVVTGHMDGAFSWNRNFLYLYKDNRFAVNNYVPADFTASVGDRFVFDYTNKSLEINGRSYPVTQRSYTDGYNDAIFYSTDYPGKFKLYSYQLYDGETLVRDFIPVKLTDGTVGLLDKVSELFYGNAGTGSFIAGPAIATEYTKLRYVESTGEQYIDTGFIPVSGATAELTFEATVVDASVESWVACVFDLSVSGYPRMRAGLVSGAYYTADTNGFTYNGTPGEYTVATGGVSKAGCTLSLYLFAQHEAANGAAHMANSKYRLYGAKFFVSGVLAMDLIPAVANGVPGMVDQLNNRFYPSNTAVMLVAGPEITDIEPAVTPEEFIAPYVDFSNILLMWSAVPGAEGYTITRDGELIADTPNTYLFDGGLDMKTQYEYGVAAYNSAGESEPVAIVAETTEFKLITDRTNADVQAVLAAINTGVLPENWFFGLKGAYNATDLNRVESAVLFVIERLKIAGWYLAVQSKYWTMTDFPTASEMHRYLENVRLLRSTLPVWIPAVPADMDRLTFAEANTIEQILEMLDAAVTNIMANVYYSNELYSGEV